MRILIIGGTPAHRGGLELFCERAQQAFRLHGKHEVEWFPAHTSFARRTAASALWNIARTLYRRQRQPHQVVWLQYVNFLDLVILLICRLLGYRVLVTPHLGVNWISQSNRILRYIGTRFLAYANAIGLLSSSQATELRIPASLVSVPLVTFLPVNLGAIPRERDHPEGPLRLIHAARLSEGKGTFLFLEICARLEECGYPFEAQLVGSYSEETKLRIDAAIAKSGIAHRVEITGPVSEDEVLARFSRSDMLLHLSRVDSFPLIVLESIGCGVFPVCLDLSGARNIIRNYAGRLIADTDPVSEAVTFIRHADIQAFRQAVGKAQRRLCQDYAWPKAVQAAEAGLREVSLDPAAAELSAVRVPLIAGDHKSPQP